MTGKRVRIVLALAVLAGCAAEPPAAPTRVPAPRALSLHAWPETARVGGEVTFNYRVSRAFEDRNLDFWIEGTMPDGRTYESEVTIRRGETQLFANTGRLGEDRIGDWTMRIIGERLPDGVVLGNPSSAAWTVVSK